MAQQEKAMGRGRRVSALRTVLFSILMAGLVAAELYGYYAVFPDFLSWLKDIDHKSTAWIGGQLSFMLPFITVCVFQTVAYRKDENGDGMCQLEKAWEILLVAVLVYGVLLPHIMDVSRTLHETAVAQALLDEKSVPKTPGGADQTLLLNVAEWFLRLTIPLMLLGAYHTLRGCRERRETVDLAAPAAATDGDMPAHAADDFNTDLNTDLNTDCNTDCNTDTQAATGKETQNYAV